MFNLFKKYAKGRYFSFALMPILGYAILAYSQGCNPSADTQTTGVVLNQQEIYNKDQPMHTYSYSAPRDVMLQLYDAIVPEMRPAWFVFINYSGPYDSCAGKGVPIPYSTQLTAQAYASNPGSTGNIPLPQAEPDGTFKPDSTLGTWVFCDYGHGLEPVYTESQVQAYFHPVKLVDGKIIHEDVAPSVTLTTQKGSVTKP